MASSQCCENPPSLSSACGVGTVEQLGGLMTYVTGSSDSKLVILLVSDVFGYEAPNLSQEFGSTLLEFLFPSSISLLDCGSLQTKLRLLDSMWWFLISYMGILMYLMILRSPFKFWLKAHGTDKGYKDAKSVIADLKSKGIAAVGAAGFCWGAKVVVELAKTGEIQAAVLCHPSFVTVDDIKEVKSPISILGAEVDKSSPPELVKQFEEILSGKTERGLHSRNKKAMELIAKGWNALNEVDRVIDCTDLNDHRLYPYFRVDSFVKIFPGVAHGWTVRYSVDDAGAVKKAEEAHEDMLAWFTKHIK